MESPDFASPGVHERVHRRLLAAEPGDAGLDADAIAAMVRQEDPLLGAPQVAGAVARVQARLAGLGEIEPLMADPSVSDVLVNGPGAVWVERHGRLERTSVMLGRRSVDLLIERTLAPLGLRADRTSPIVDARLADGSRVHVVLPPLAVDGPYVSIRRFATTHIALTSFCSEATARLLEQALRARLNIVLCGGTGAGKTTLLNSLCQGLAFGERVVTVEDAAELRLPGAHVVRLETRPATPDGLPAQTVRDLLRAALRMRPDRLVVGEVRGAETIDMLQAMNTGHAGALSTCHANGPADCLRRLETLGLMGDVELPLVVVREQIVRAIDLLVHVARVGGGGRRVVGVAEVCNDPEDSRRVRTLSDGETVIGEVRRAER